MGRTPDGRARCRASSSSTSPVRRSSRRTRRGELAGFLVGFDSPDHPGESYVHFLGVRPDQRGSGLGRDLHDRFAREAAARGRTTVRCVTSTVNTASVAFHTSIGFEVEGVDEPLVVEGVDDAAGHVRMVRRLAGDP